KLNPEFATALGDHRYDDRINDYSSEGIRKNLDLEKRYQQRLIEINPGTLTEVNAIDYEILKSRVDSAIFDLEILREHEWNPMQYNLGGAIYGLLAREFAPLNDRLKNIGERLKAIPAALEAAKANLKNSPKIHTETAILQNQGTISLVRDEL